MQYRMKVAAQERIPMPFKFVVGQTVEYTPIGEKKPGRYLVVRQMPVEDQGLDLRYRIKSEAEAYERNVVEHQLNADEGADDDYAATKPELPPS
jgi:hypothetical protein